jgi:hypothetical protein
MFCKSRDLATVLVVAVLAAKPAFAQYSYGPPLSNGQAGSPYNGQASSPYNGQTGSSANGQAGNGLNPPLPVLAPGQGPALPAAAPAGFNGYAGFSPASAPHCNCNEDNNGFLLKCDPCLDSPAWAPPGWFVGAEADLVTAHIKNGLQGQVTVGGTTDTFHLPIAELGWTVAPRIELGYRFAEGAGELLFAYKFLTTSAGETLADFDAAGDPANLRSRLTINAWDIDYGSREYSLWPYCDMKWRAGFRVAGVFFDSTATSPLLEQHEANYFVGAGPHLGLDLRRFFKGTGLELFGRFETAFLIGEGSQSYDDVVSAVGVAPVGGANRNTIPLLAPWASVQAGIGWVPPGFEQLTLSAGYTLEGWWDLQTLTNSSSVAVQGVFFRAEFRY